MHDVLVRFFPCMEYIDSSHHDTLRYEWLLVCYYHLVVCLILVMAWIRGCWLWLCYHDDYYIYFTFDIDIGQRSTCLCML
jgi:hypothetical protein